jgi:hypothetical protein
MAVPGDPRRPPPRRTFGGVVEDGADAVAVQGGGHGSHVLRGLAAGEMTGKRRLERQARQRGPEHAAAALVQLRAGG